MYYISSDMLELDPLRERVFRDGSSILMILRLLPVSIIRRV